MGARQGIGLALCHGRSLLVLVVLTGCQGVVGALIFREALASAGLSSFLRAVVLGVVSLIISIVEIVVAKFVYRSMIVRRHRRTRQ